MDKVKIKNSGPPIQIGPVVLYKGATETVSKKDLKIYGEGKAGAFTLDNFITVLDEDHEKKLAAEKEMIEGRVLQKAEEKIRPKIEDEIKEKLNFKFKKQINAFEKRIETLNAEIDRLNEKIKSLEKDLDGRPLPQDEIETDDEIDKDLDETPEKDKKKSKDPDEFVFDPKKHSIESRGGYWFVMEGNKKVTKSLSQEDRTKYEALLK